MIEYLLPTKSFIPNEFHHSFFDVDFQALYNQGFRYVITDLDNTLISYEETHPTTQIIETFQTLKNMGFAITLLSNNHTNRIDTFCESLHVGGFANAKKPLKYGFQKAMKSMNGASKQNTIIIGDQLMTDVWGANRFGAYSILVNPLKRKTEKWFTKINRNIETKVIARIAKKYPNHYQQLDLSKRV